jgi:DNA-binding beta-propeller fold protein YncE
MTESWVKCKGAAMKWKMEDGIVLVILAMIVAFGTWRTVSGKAAPAQAQKPAAGVPIYQVDPYWPRMEGNWTFGDIGGIAIDPTNNHVWVFQRPDSLESDENYAAQKPPIADCCVPAPPVMEFDEAGNFIQGWGGPGPGYDWVKRPHGISIDYRGNVWLTGGGGNAVADDQVLKFTKSGKFLLQIGHPGKSAGSNDTENLNEPTKAVVYEKTNEVFISDGYVNRRVIVFDADTGMFKRMWGAYGNKPDDEAPRIIRPSPNYKFRFPTHRPQDQPMSHLFSGPPPQQFNLVHSVAISNDDLVYVADRTNNRVQVFKPDGTFVKEAFVGREVATPDGTVYDFAFSPDRRQQFLYVPGGDQHVRILNRDTLQLVGKFGRNGHYAGQFYHIHVVAADSKGNIYTGEAKGHRVQKFLFKGFSSTSNQ